MTTELYRFRSVSSLLDDYNELEQQYIYFAKPDELNDPTEGLDNIYWRGDHIVWRNLFRHYLYCMHTTYYALKLCGSHESLHPNHIPIRGDPSGDTNDFSRRVLEEIYGEVFDSLAVDDFIEELVNQSRMLFRDELLSYMDPFHLQALPIVERIHGRHGIGAAVFDVPNEAHPFELAHKALKLASSLDDETFLPTLYSFSSQWYQNRYALHKHAGLLRPSTDPFASNIKLLVYDFPRIYLRELGKLVFRPWYTACFARNYNSISMWSHYADRHRGVALVFRSGAPEDNRHITLRSITSVSDRGEKWSPSPMECFPVQYVDKLMEVDFFRSMGDVSQNTLMTFWYTGEDGSVSQCLTDIMDMGVDEWRAKYWRSFLQHATTKPNDWGHEQESRLILYSLITDLADPDKRKLTFDFRSLKGIIFGIHTSDANKMKLLDVIREKCGENGRGDFEVFQAFYCPRTGVIDRVRLPIKFSS